ncbi:ankyrin repeat domain-containing protein [Paraferrimonas sp. SM1919]|uniref:ankyrin repeat domain-containing protein n=1 Tax=Paraferrimonas sp. SM1919 TaxID=2662263 RepID=UPI0013D75EAD|nr:hypothetical protein [Paraferrimonas sp. SM1919]
MNSLIKNLVKVVLLLFITSCTFSKSSPASCFPVEVLKKGRKNWKDYPLGINVKIGSKQYVDGAYQGYRQKYCGELPSRISVRWSTTQDTFKGKFLDFSAVVPKNFRSNPSRKLLVTVDGNDQVRVMFKVKLSELTTKYLEQPLTEAQREQQQIDEQLWKAVEVKNINNIRKLISQGANVNQPWMGLRYRMAPTMSRHVLTTQNAEIIDAFLSNGMKLSDHPFHSYLFWPILYNDMAMLKVFLKHGFSPDHLYSEQTEYGNFSSKGPKKFEDRVLYYAVSKGNVEAVRLLLEYGASTDFITHEGVKFVTWAKGNAKDEIVSLLIKNTNS